MKAFRSFMSFRIIFPVLALVLSSSVVGIPGGAVCNLNEFPVIENSTFSAVVNAENSTRIKPGFPGIFSVHVFSIDSLLASGYACFRIPYLSHKDIYLTAESQRGPPCIILS